MSAQLSQHRYPATAKPANKLTKTNGPETYPTRKVDHLLRILYRSQVEFSVQGDTSRATCPTDRSLLHHRGEGTLENNDQSAHVGWSGRKKISFYTRRGIYGSNGRSQGDSRAPKRSAMRCTTIYMSSNIREHALGSGAPQASHHVLFIAIG